MFEHPSNLMMSLVDLFQWALLIGLFIWFMNWPRQPSVWELQKKRKQELMELRCCDPGPEDLAVKPTEPSPDSPVSSN